MICFSLRDSYGTICYPPKNMADRFDNIYNSFWKSNTETKQLWFAFPGGMPTVQFVIRPKTWRTGLIIFTTAVAASSRADIMLWFAFNLLFDNIYNSCWNGKASGNWLWFAFNLLFDNIYNSETKKGAKPMKVVICFQFVIW